MTNQNEKTGTAAARVPVESAPERFADDLARIGRRVLVLYGTELPAGIRNRLNDYEGGFHLFEMSGAEPKPLEESVGVGAMICRHERIDALLVVGGDTALAFASKIEERFRRQDPAGRGAGIVRIAL